MPERWFPIQQGGRVDWAAAEQAYRHYRKLFGGDQTLERLAERGGFGVFEFCSLLRGQSPARAMAASKEDAALLVLAVADELGSRWKREASHA